MVQTEDVMIGWQEGWARLQISGRLKSGLFIDDSRANAYVVSHVNSGQFIAAFRVEFNVYAFAEALLDLADWTAIADYGDVSQELEDAVRSGGHAVRGLLSQCMISAAARYRTFKSERARLWQ